MLLNYESFVVNGNLLITIQQTNVQIVLYFEITKSLSGRKGKKAVRKKLMRGNSFKKFYWDVHSIIQGTHF